VLFLKMKDFQEKVNVFCKKNQIDSPIEHRTLDIMAELGELSKEILKVTNYGRTSFRGNEKVKVELGDVFFSIITLANKLDIDLSEALDIVLKKYEKRLIKGSPGSEND